jgi:hypothetical protein
MDEQRAQPFVGYHVKGWRHGAATCSQTILHLLEQQGCEHFKTFESRNFEFPSSEDMPTASKTIDLITKIILHNFWAKSGREYAEKKVIDHLTKVRSFAFHP